MNWVVQTVVGREVLQPENQPGFEHMIRPTVRYSGGDNSKSMTIYASRKILFGNVPIWNQSGLLWEKGASRSKALEQTETRFQKGASTQAGDASGMGEW
jgi:hypothetical protein